ncbi:hypothetical protein [Paenibacillus sp. FSL R7-0331]|uniref:hypothetical protein n=1 Tax=Paenibacillus sp. FSL R7-0331 TaxID=1536773 RepID=UPI0004F64B23|nr:hypothetical protein [Paenibacillus sp. FSL R7-0331]AIQ52318.1 hypothetical protein R70331_12935 [Paenibacillus sp. FSL R7-0331]
MKMIKTALLTAILLLSGCSLGDGRPAAEDLDLALAGMDGRDAVSFEGSAALLVAGKPVEESALYYGGKLQDHNRVSLYSLLPDGKGGPEAAAGQRLQQLEQSGTAGSTYYTSLVKKDGEWKPHQPAALQEGAGTLAALNPLRQLEELQEKDKEVTEEAGSAGGSRVLRVRLSSAAAKQQLVQQLEQEMQAVRPGTSDAGYAAQPAEVRSAMNNLWLRKSGELKQKLDKAEVTSVYFLKVDTRRNLPKRLTWTRTVRYPGASGTSAEEAFVTKVDFYGYQ